MSVSANTGAHSAPDSLVSDLSDVTVSELQQVEIHRLMAGWTIRNGGDDQRHVQVLAGLDTPPGELEPVAAEATPATRGT
jgi:hypothetical protein